MPRLLRRILHNRWQLETESHNQWLAADEIPADPVTELKTTKNTLSVWDVGSDQTLVERAAAALTVESKNLDNSFDYVLFDSDLVQQCGIEFAYSKGRTSDEELNEKHISLMHISAQRLVGLADHLLRRASGVEFGRLLPKSVGAHILEGISQKRLDPSTLGGRIQESLDKWFPGWRNAHSSNES